MADPLLRYAILPVPSPLQAATTGRLTLVVSNSTTKPVQVKSIVVNMLVGTNARALVADATGIEATVPQGWSSNQAAGEFTFTPNTPQAGEVGTAGLAFVLAGLRVNDQPGTATVSIDETATNSADPPIARSTDLPLAKFPQQFHVSDLTATPLALPAGGTATLQWAGSPATYRLQYSPGNGPPVDEPVGNAGPRVSQPLFRTPNVGFTLVVSVSVPGQDVPLVLQKQVAVDVRAMSIDRFDALPPVVPVNGVARLSWRTSNAVSAMIQPGSRKVDTSGSLYVVVPQTQAFTLIASDGVGNTISDQKTVTVDPSLNVNAGRYTFDGLPGTRGGDSGPSVDGGRGGRGRDAGGHTFTAPPLDLTGAGGRVAGISSRGGDGGSGGRGGSDPQFRGGNGGPGGDGGNGGSPKVELTPGTGQPVLYTTDVSGGKGGAGAKRGSGKPPGTPGTPGNPGTPGTISFAGPPLAEAAAAPTPARGDTLLGYALLAETDEGGVALWSLSVCGAVGEVDAIAVPLSLLAKPDGWTAQEADGVTLLVPPPGPPGHATFTFLASTAAPALVVREQADGQTRTAEFPLAATGGTVAAD